MSSDHKSIFSKWGKKGQKLSDPLSWLLGDKYTDLVSDKIPEATNSLGSQVMKPFEKVDKAINPVRKIPVFNEIGDEVAKKPGDAVGMAVGAYFGAGALAGGAGSGGAAAGAGGAGGGAAAAGGGGAAAASGGGSGASAAGGSAGGSMGGVSKWAKMASSMGQSMQNQRSPEIDPLDQEQARFDTAPEDHYQPVPTYMVSSKKAKVPSMSSAVGGRAPQADIDDPIDRNGVEILAIQNLNQRLEAAQKTLASLKKGTP